MKSSRHKRLDRKDGPTEKMKLADRMELTGRKSLSHVMDVSAMATPTTTASAWIVEFTLRTINAHQ